MPKSGLVGPTIHRNIQKLNAAFLVNMPNRIIEVYDEDKTLLAVFQRGQDDICDSVPLEGYASYIHQKTTLPDPSDSL